MLGLGGGRKGKNASFTSQCICKIELRRLAQSLLNAWCEIKR